MWPRDPLQVLDSPRTVTVSVFRFVCTMLEPPVHSTNRGNIKETSRVSNRKLVHEMRWVFLFTDVLTSPHLSS